ncbi:hypothetical protein B0T24DRAFT_361475 [Lasiosphaeria ovina]|uniref:Uncharacterized protein n=1 Tax=Lasiosphaeria ovina TaxID=92902 RepID=A0AAE0N3G1_9PEZI|nr:hypothetical protein B0T24DRAFT_361475 [Lasiosphaeria ovina]
MYELSTSLPIVWVRHPQYEATGRLLCTVSLLKRSAPSCPAAFQFLPTTSFFKFWLPASFPLQTLTRFWLRHLLLRDTISLYYLQDTIPVNQFYRLHFSEIKSPLAVASDPFHQPDSQIRDHDAVQDARRRRPAPTRSSQTAIPARRHDLGTPRGHLPLLPPSHRGHHLVRHGQRHRAHHRRVRASRRRPTPLPRGDHIFDFRRPRSHLYIYSCARVGAWEHRPRRRHRQAGKEGESRHRPPARRQRLRHAHQRARGPISPRPHPAPPRPAERAGDALECFRRMPRQR